nr:MAG TPA: hypothetical protein [Caudoviricetes sp.]
MYTMKDFIEKKIAVTFANRAERIEFLKLCQKAGLMWRGGMLPLKSFAIGSDLDGRQIECGYMDKRDKNLTHSTSGCHKNEGWKTVPFSEFQREETIGVIKRNGNTITVHMGDLHGTAKCSPDDQFDLYTGCELALRRALGREDEVKKAPSPMPLKYFEPGKRYRVSVRAWSKRYVALPARMRYNDGEEVTVKNKYSAVCGDFVYGPECCEEITETEKPAEPEKPKYYNGKMVCVENGGFNSWWTVGKIYEYKDGIVTADDGDERPQNGQEPYRDAEDAKHPGLLVDKRHNPKVTMLEIKE